MTDDQTKYEVPREIIIRANRITFSSGTRIGGGHFAIEARWGHASASVGKRVFIFGGQGESLYSNTCVYDATSSVWNELHTLGKGPSSRYAHTATLVHDTSIMVFGGRNNKKYLNDLYCLNLPTMSWSTFHFDKVEPDARAGHTCTFVPSAVGGSNKMVLFGGNHSNKYFTSLYILEFPKSQNDTIRWIKPSIRGNGPSGRTGHTASLVKDSENVVFIGGYDGKKSLIDIWLLNTRDLIWSQIKPTGISPSPRHGHTAVSVGNRYIVIHGGCNESNFLNDVHILDMETWSWISQPAVAGLSLFNRFHHTSNLIETGEMIVYGGCSSGVLYSDMCVLDLKCLMPLPREQLPIPISSDQQQQQQQQLQPQQQQQQQQQQLQPQTISPIVQSNTNSTNTPPPTTASTTATTTTTTTTTTNSNLTPAEIAAALSKTSFLPAHITPGGPALSSSPINDSKYLRSQLDNALALLLAEQKQKTLLSNELEQSKEAHREMVAEQTKYDFLEKEMSKLELTLKKEQSQKSKVQETVTKLNVSIKEKDNVIASLSQALKLTMKDKPTPTKIKDLTEVLNQTDTDSQKLKSAADTFIFKALEIQIQELNKEKEKLMETIEQMKSQSNEFHNVKSLIEKRFAVDSLNVEHLIGDKLEQLTMADLDRLEEIHHKGLKSVGMAKQNLLTQQLLKLQKEKEESQICLICVDRGINTILLPCKHRCLCDVCSSNLTTCPLCRSEISDKIKYY